MRALVIAALAACWSGSSAPSYRYRVRHVYVTVPCLTVWSQPPSLMHTPCDGMTEADCHLVNDSDIAWHRERLVEWAASIWPRCRSDRE